MFAYVGGKTKQAKWIYDTMPNKVSYNIYVEVFGGAMWNFIGNDFISNTVVYNDVNIYLYNLWTCIKNHKKFLKVLKSKNFKLNDKDTYNEFKKSFFDGRDCKIPDYDLASEYIYLLSHCFSGDISGGMRTTQQSLIPFMNRLKNPKFISRIDAITHLRNVSFENVIDEFDGKKTFFYIDPPYWETEDLYSFHSFGKKQHFELKKILHNIKGKFLLSYYNYTELDDMYPRLKFFKFEKDYKRSSVRNRNGADKPTATEVLISNYEPEIKKENGKTFIKNNFFE